MSPAAETVAAASSAARRNARRPDAHRQPGDAPPRGICRGAHHPPERTAHGVGLRSGERYHDRGIRKRADDDAGDEQRPHVRASASSTDASDPQGNEHSANPAGERRERDYCVARDAERECDNGTDRGPAGNAQQVGLSQRISKRPLEGGTARTEAGSDKRAEHDTRKPQVANDGNRRRVATSAQRVNHGGERHRHSTARDGEHCHDEQCDDEHEPVPALESPQ